MVKVIRLLTNQEFNTYLKLKESERYGTKAKKYIESLNLFEIEDVRSTKTRNRQDKNTKD